MVRLLSIDVGIKNLAMCLIDSETKKIIQWEVDGVPPLSDEGLFENLNIHLNERTWVLDADTVLIERQPDKNKLIKSVEHFLHAYFIIHGKHTLLYDAKHKIPDIVGPGKVKYRQRKNASIERCRKFIVEYNPDRVRFFDSHTKKDDLADTVMQALSYNAPNIPVAKKKLTPRKPTSNQSETRYSKANLAWIYKNGLHTKDKRFTKDLLRYYKNIQNLIDDFGLHAAA